MKINKGFTLLELLIVIAILAVLGALVIFVLNPAETLAKARDSQRIADLSTIKTALGIMLTSSSTASLDGVGGGSRNNKCLDGSGTKTAWMTNTSSTPSGFTAISTSTTPDLVDGTGWIPVNLNTLTGGSPISNYPVDPINDTGELLYRFSCNKSPLGFEVDAKLESTAFITDDPKMTKDGGNNSARYEAGTKLNILP